MVEIKKVEIWSVIKITFLLSLIVGLVLGFFYFSLISVVGQIAGSFGAPESELGNITGGIGFFLAFFIAIFTAVFYTLVSAVIAVLYNVFAGWAGGIRVELSRDKVEEVSALND